MSFTVVIPARFASSRLPGKPLADLAGKSAYQHYSSTDAFTTSPPTPILTTAAVNRALPCPMLLAA